MKLIGTSRFAPDGEELLSVVREVASCTEAARGTVMVHDERRAACWFLKLRCSHPACWFLRLRWNHRCCSHRRSHRRRPRRSHRRTHFRAHHTEVDAGLLSTGEATHGSMQMGISLSNSSSSGKAASANPGGLRLMEALITLPSESRRVTAVGVLHWITMFTWDSSDLGGVAGESTTATSSAKDVEEVAPPVYTSSTKDDEEAKNDVEHAAPPVYNAMIPFAEHAPSRKPARSCSSSLIGIISVAKTNATSLTRRFNDLASGWIRSRDRRSRIATMSRKTSGSSLWPVVALRPTLLTCEKVPTTSRAKEPKFGLSGSLESFPQRFLQQRQCWPRSQLRKPA